MEDRIVWVSVFWLEITGSDYRVLFNPTGVPVNEVRGEFNLLPAINPAFQVQTDHMWIRCGGDRLIG